MRNLRRRMYQTADTTIRRDVTPAPTATPATAPSLILRDKFPVSGPEYEVGVEESGAKPVLAAPEDLEWELEVTMDVDSGVDAATDKDVTVLGAAERVEIGKSSREIEY